MLSDSQLANIRGQFPIFRRAIYLNSCWQGAWWESSEAMLRDFVGSWHQYGSPWEMWVEQYETCRREFAAMIGAEADEVAVVPSVSAAVSSLATAFDFRQRPGVVMGAFEFPTMGHVWLAQQPRGARVRFIEPERDRFPH